MTDGDKRKQLRRILNDPTGAIAPGVTDALFARLAQDFGYRAVHLSGNAIHKNFCLPDRNLLTVTQIAQRIGQISEATEIPLIVDGGSAGVEPMALGRAVKYFERAGAAAVRFEDALINEYGAPAEALNIPPKEVIADRIKAAADARSDPSLVLVARSDARPKESLAQILDRLAAYTQAGADAVGVQLSAIEDFRHIGAHAPAPVVTLWPKDKVSAADFFSMGYRVALMPSSLPLAALTGARNMLLALQQNGSDRGYFAQQENFAATEAWYKKLGSTLK